MASLSAAHKRGGTHRVKDEHRTNTIFDEWDYKQLKNECIARKIWIKDSKKHEMAIALAKDDQHKKRAERDAIVQHERRKQELEREKQLENDRRLKADAAKHRKRMRKEARRDRGESVSDDTPDEDELRVMHEMAGNDVDRGYQAAVGGHALSEESWESTLTESSFCSTNQGIGPGCRLRLFEWSYLGMPSDVSWSATSTRLTEDRENVKYTVALSGRDIGKSLSGTDEEESSALDSPTADEERDISESSTGTESESSSPASPTTTEEGTEPAPRKIPYAPLKVNTIASKEKLFFPGQTYPPGVDPDFVPILSPRTRNAVRNGILKGVLCKATVERATSWTTRTTIQGWNARMFFSLPPRNKSKKLSEVYDKWALKNRKLMRIKPGVKATKETRQQRHAQRHRNRPKRLVEVLEASQYRPPAICYLPAYLDYKPDEEDREDEVHDTLQTIDNLFYIRFSGCDVPHYYFWTRNGQWDDPTIPNPGWRWDPAILECKRAKAERRNKKILERERIEMIERRRNDLTRHPRTSSKRLPDTQTPEPMITKSPFPSSPTPASSPSPISTPTPAPTLPSLIAHIETLLTTNGLAHTLHMYRMKWLSDGKHDAWMTFGRAIPALYPGGALPVKPPVKGKGGISVALKLASIEMLGGKTVLPPYSGDEAWTGRDRLVWGRAEGEGEKMDEVGGSDAGIRGDDYADVQRARDDGDDDDDHSSRQEEEEIGELDPNKLEALFRRSSIASPFMGRYEEWLEQVSLCSPISVESLAGSPVGDGEMWDKLEESSMQDRSMGLDLVCPFCLEDLSSMAPRVS
jgi:hypothetical protein